MSLRICADSTGPLLFNNGISIKILCADSIHVSVTEGLWQLKGLVNLQKTFYKLASNEKTEWQKSHQKFKTVTEL